VKYVKNRSIKFIIKFVTARVIVVNDFVDSYLPIRKSQLLINTWHGGGWFKKIGLTDNGASNYEKHTYTSRAKKVKTFIASSEYFVETVLRKSFDYTGTILRIGMPRNAILFQENGQRERVRIQRFIGTEIDRNSIVVLYAPTFRGSAGDARWIDSFDELNIRETSNAIEKRFKRPVVFLYRAHHAFNRKTHNDMLYYDVSNYCDMQELLHLADILVSDYSSCMWDFAIQHKIVLVYAPDAKKYIDSRGFFLDINKWPFVVSFNQDELVQSILNFSEKEYGDRLSKLLTESVSYESKSSIDESVKYICDYMEVRE